MKTIKTFPKLLTLSLLSLSVSLLLGCGPQTANEHIAEAQKFIADNNNTAAIVALKNAVQADPKSAEARFELGKLYLEAKQYESAEKELNRASEFGYAPAKVLPLLTKAFQQTGAHAALSKINIDEADLTPSERAEMGYFKVLSLIRLAKIDEARALIEELASIDTTSVYKGLTSAYLSVLNKKYDVALDAVNLLKQQSPQDAEVLKLLAQLYLALNQPQDAADVFKDYVQFYPDDSKIKFVLAKLLVDLGRMKEAEPFIDSLLTINAQNPLLNQLKAAVRAAQEDYAAALKYAEKAIVNGSTDASLRLVAGYSAFKVGDYTSANRHLTFIASELPDNHPALRMLAASQLQIGLTNEAGDVLERIDDLSKDDAPLLSKASYLLLKDGYEKDARKLVKKSNDLSATAEDLTRLGLLQLSLNNLDGIVNLEDAVEKAPELASAQTTLATAYVATGQYDKALKLAASWKENQPKDIKPYLIKGQIHVKRQELELAQREFEAAVELDKSAPEAKMALVNLAIMQKNGDQADERLQLLLKQSPSYLPGLAANYLLSKQKGDEAKAIAKIKELVQKTPQDVNAQLLLARVYVAEQDYVKSLAVLDTFKEDKDLPRSYWKLKGQSLLSSNQRNKAEAHYDAWLAAYPNDKEATIGRLLILESESKFADAVKMAQRFLDKRDDVQMQVLLTHFLLLNSDNEQAKKTYDALPADTLNLPIAKGFLARLQVADKKFDDAMPNAVIAYESSQNYRNVALIVFILEQLNKTEQATSFLEKHIANHPDDIGSRMLLAERQIDGDTEKAKLSYQLAIENNPNNFVALNNLAYLNLQEGQLTKAKEYAKKAVDIMPTSPAALDTLAQVYTAEKNYDEALTYYEQAVKEKEVSEEIYLNYIDVLFHTKQDVLAKRKLTQRAYSEPESLKRVAELKAKYNL